MVFAAESDPAAARRVRRLAAQGRLRRLYSGIYTSNTDSLQEAIVLRHWQAIVGHLVPNSVLSYRSAFDGNPVLTRGKTRRRIKLPGLIIEVIPGPGPRLALPANNTSYGSFYLASDPRRYLENLTRGRD